MVRFLLPCAVLLSAVLLCACEGQIGRPATCELPGAKVRRLTRAELDATLTAGLGTPVSIGQNLAAEDMQLGYFGHDSLQVSTLFADQLDSATATLAKERAAEVTCASGEAERACARRVLRDLAGMTWRRPITEEETTELLALFDAGRMDEDFQTGLALAMQGVFESTGTLYRTEIGETMPGTGKSTKLTQWEIASELSFLATGLPPDAALRVAASNGELSKKEVRVQHLRRLLDTPAAVVHLRSFVEQWFGLTNMSKVQKNNEYFPKFTTQLRNDMAASAYKMMEAVLAGSKGSVPELLKADYTYANDAVAEFLGSTERPGMSMSRISTSSLPRRGLLTHPAFLSVYAHNDDGSPVLRGRMVRTRLLCEEIPPPPPTVVAAVAPVSPDATTRERAAAHATPSCNGCHKMMDPIGFGLEGYDGFGEARTMESGKAIDDTGEILGSDVEGPFKGGPELAAKLAQSKQVGECATTQLMRFSIGRLEKSGDQCTMDLMLQKYTDNGGTLYGALEGLVESDAFVERAVLP